MKKYLISAATLAAFASLSFAQAPAPAAAPAAAEPMKMETPKVVKKAARPAKKEVKRAEIVTGNITVIDTATNAVTVQDEKGMDKVLTVDAMKIADLKVGQHVKATIKDGKATVKIIKKHEGRKPEAKK